VGDLLEERLSVDYGLKKPKVGFNVFPSSHISTGVVDPYNAVMTAHAMTEH
jgi:tubulin alpha